MQNVQERLKNIELSTQKLVHLVIKLKEENVHLKREIAQFEEDKVLVGEEKEEKNIEIDVNSVEETKENIKQALETYIEEIDHCIELLSK